MEATNTVPTYIWPGLAPYQEIDRHLFYGRSREILDLTRKIVSSRLTILFGPSGAGKTSLLQAGVFPNLRKQRLLPVMIRLDFPSPGQPITPAIDQFGRALTRECDKLGIMIHVNYGPWFENRGSQLTLWEWMRSFELRDPDGSPWQPLFILDQFEEVFTLGKNVRGLDDFLHCTGVL